MGGVGEGWLRRRQICGGEREEAWGDDPFSKTLSGSYICNHHTRLAGLRSYFRGRPLKCPQLKMVSII